MSREQFYQYLYSLGFDDTQIDGFRSNLETLTQIQWRHLQRYPFQSLSTVLSEPIELEPEVVFDKLVTQRRGGYCYELNGLLTQVLQHIGFMVNTLTGYIVHDNNPTIPKARTHTLRHVTVEGQDYLVDVGFGGLAPTAPLKMILEDIQNTPHGRYRLTQFVADSSDELADQADTPKPKSAHTMTNNHTIPVWVLSAEVKDSWQMLYAFDLIPRNSADLQVGNWFVSTHPQSPFRKRLMVSRIEENGVRHTLLNNHYHRHQLGQPSISQTIDSEDELLNLLENTFHINTDNLTPQQHDQLTLFLENLS